MNIPDGEKLLLTIDRVVERECEWCEGKGVCEYSHWVDDLMVDGGQREVITEGSCAACHGTGKRIVRLRGFVEVEAYVNGVLVKDWPEQETTYGSANTRDAVLAAYRDGTLPPAIAKNMEECDA